MFTGVNTVKTFYQCPLISIVKNSLLLNRLFLFSDSQNPH